MNIQIAKILSSKLEVPVEQIEALLSRPPDLKNGDITFPCFSIAKQKGVPPPKLAQELATGLTLPDDIEKVVAAGPYLNFFRKKPAVVKQVVETIQKQGSNYGGSYGNGRKIVIEYLSLNIAKPFHIGHLRTTLIGLSLDKIYRHAGFDVTSIDHVGDWGTQFGFVYAGCSLFGKAENTTIYELVNTYIRANALRKAQEAGAVPPEDADKPDVNQIAREYFKRLEANDKDALEFWEWCLTISLEYLEKLCARLGVKFDLRIGESFFRDKLETVESSLKESGILEESRGALGVDLGKELGFVRVFADDGRSLYITRDLAAADYRLKTFNAEKILYVVAAPQTLHFKQLKAVLGKMNHPAAESIVHVAYGNVPGISTRAGSADKIWLDMLLDEAKEKALSAYQAQVSKRPEGIDENQVAEAVGLGGIYFNYLCRSNIKEFHFKWEEALNFQGDTGPYIQYAYARLSSIESKAKEAGIEPSQNISGDNLTDATSYQLVALLEQFPNAVRRAQEEYEPYYVATSTLDIARAFSAAYNNLRVIGAELEVAKERLALLVATKSVLKIGLRLLGMTPLERM